MTINCDILRDIITDHKLCDTQRDELNKTIEFLTPYKLYYKNGVVTCKCGYKYISNENDEMEEVCPECGQVIFVGGYERCVARFDDSWTNKINSIEEYKELRGTK